MQYVYCVSYKGVNRFFMYRNERMFDYINEIMATQQSFTPITITVVQVSSHEYRRLELEA
jgi:hypothetical protein